MSELTDILSYNQRFVESGEYEKYFTNKYPRPRARHSFLYGRTHYRIAAQCLGLENGDAKLIKNAGALVTHPWGSVMRSLLVAVFELKVKEIMVIAHHDCGMRGLHAEEFLQRVHDSNIPDDRIETLRNAGIDLDGWLTGFDNVEDSVRHTVELIRKHPLMPDNIAIHGLVIHPTTGKLNLIVDGSLPASDGQNI